MVESLNPILNNAQQLVVIAEGLTFDVTLIFDGVVIQGHLIDELNYRQYVFVPKRFDPAGLAKKILQEIPKDGQRYHLPEPRALQGSLKRFRDQIWQEYEAWALTPISKVDEGGKYRFDLIHLEDVSIYAPGKTIKVDYWRVPLEDISSVHVGEVKIRPIYPAE